MHSPAEPHLIRPRLHDRLDEGAARAVTLLRAGPGWGKTALVAGWAARRPSPVAWLTLRHRHRSVPAFCTDAAAALRAAFPPSAAPGRFAHVTGEVQLRRLATGFRRPVLLVLDDLHAVVGSPALRVLAGLVRRQPPGLRFVLLSRTLPGLPLKVSRAAGELVELDADTLRFDDGETAALLDLLKPATEPSVAAGLAEGWPVALRLAAGAHDAEPGEVIGDYLSREVIAELSAPVRRFLMQTSIVDELPAELADALTAATGGRQMLAGLRRDTGLVTGDRYHGQLRAQARRMLERETPEDVAQLHARAARWYAGQRMAPEALRHAADAGDWDFLSRLVVTVAPGLSLSPHRQVFAEAIERIPAELIFSTAEFVVCAAMRVLLNGDFRAVPMLLDRARELLAERKPDERLAVETMLDIIEVGSVMRMTGDIPAMVTATTRILDRMRDLDPRALPISAQIRAVAKINKGMALVWTLQIEDARRHLLDGLTEAEQLGMPLTAANAQGHLALLAYFDGSLREAERLASAAQQQTERLDAIGAVQATAAHLTLALAAVERDHLAEAQALLHNARRSEAEPPEATFAVVSLLVRAHLAIAAGDHPAATAALRQAREEVVPSLRAPLVVRWLDAVEAEIDLLADQPVRVVQRLGKVARPSSHEMVVLGRARLALGDQDGGEDLLYRAAAGADRISAVTALIALALAAEKRGDTARSEAAAAEAVALAEPEGVHRPFRALGAGHLRKPEPQQALLEPLSERELEVLQFLPSVLTAHEIAEALGVSINTVRAHLRSIYRKLGATRRREAVITAAARGLLSRR
ncbi:LuxR C-terminal-related transcriptional regulator [Actinoplanes sp. NBC_00393]|uniref:LuxR C-terminal-related transcriptional regulator n=1 Tax=Actinoplanes sp. NBC_00393 TaxID=2975953 RepID=UPI002E23576B